MSSVEGLCVNSTQCEHGECVPYESSDVIMACECDYGWYEETHCTLNKYSNLEGTFYFAALHALLFILGALLFTHELVGNMCCSSKSRSGSSAMSASASTAGQSRSKKGNMMSLLTTPLFYAKWSGLLFLVSRVVDEGARVYFSYIKYLPQDIHVASRCVYYLGFLFAMYSYVSIFLVWTEIAQKVKKLNSEYEASFKRIKIICWVTFAIVGSSLIGLTTWSVVDPKGTLVPLLVAAIVGIYGFVIAVAGIVYSRRASSVIKEREVMSHVSQKFLYKNKLFMGAHICFMAYVVGAIVVNVGKLATERSSTARGLWEVVPHTPLLLIQFGMVCFIYLMIESVSPLRHFFYVRVVRWFDFGDVTSTPSSTSSRSRYPDASGTEPLTSMSSD